MRRRALRGVTWPLLGQSQTESDGARGKHRFLGPGWKRLQTARNSARQHQLVQPPAVLSQQSPSRRFRLLNGMFRGFFQSGDHLLAIDIGV